jgi:DNA primase
MRFPPSLLDEIRARLPVSQVVARKVKLKRTGRELTGLSPFKSERTPSFTVNDHKGFYHCFASGEHGDIFTFLMKMEGLSFTEAVERLANEAGVPLPVQAPRDVAREDHLTRVRLALEAACAFFQSSLKGAEGKAARDYLDMRSVTADEVAAFRLGFAPASRTALKAHLAARGFSDREMIDAGLLIHGEDIAVPYDRFRGRLIFPITDHKDRVIAFGGRALAPDQQPKYLNSPDTPLFHKGQVLYNLARARPAAYDAKQIIVAEGYMDVIALSRAGLAHAVAPLGTALTGEQMKLLWSLVPEPTLCLDGDTAGRKAAFRSIDTALPLLTPGHSLRFVFLPDGQDPDDVVRTKGAEAMRTLAAAPQPLIDVLWMREREAHPHDTPEQRAAFDERLRTLAAAITNPTVRYHYSSALRERLRQAFPFAGGRATLPASLAQRYPRTAWNGADKARFGQRTAVRALLEPASQQLHAMAGASLRSARERLILLAMINHPWLLDRYAEEIAGLPFADHDHERLCAALLEAHAENEALDKAGLASQLHREGFGPLLMRIESSVTHKSDQQFQQGTPEADVIGAWCHILALQHRSVSLERELRDAEQAYIDDQTPENFERLRLLKEQAAHTS